MKEVVLGSGRVRADMCWIYSRDLTDIQQRNSKIWQKTEEVSEISGSDMDEKPQRYSRDVEEI